MMQNVTNSTPATSSQVSTFSSSSIGEGVVAAMVAQLAKPVINWLLDNAVETISTTAVQLRRWWNKPEPTEEAQNAAPSLPQTTPETTARITKIAPATSSSVSHIECSTDHAQHSRHQLHPMDTNRKYPEIPNLYNNSFFNALPAQIQQGVLAILPPDGQLFEWTGQANTSLKFSYAFDVFDNSLSDSDKNMVRRGFAQISEQFNAHAVESEYFETMNIAPYYGKETIATSLTFSKEQLALGRGAYWTIGYGPDEYFNPETQEFQFYRFNPSIVFNTLYPLSLYTAMHEQMHNNGFPHPGGAGNNPDYDSLDTILSYNGQSVNRWINYPVGTLGWVTAMVSNINRDHIQSPMILDAAAGINKYGFPDTPATEAYLGPDWGVRTLIGNQMTVSLTNQSIPNSIYCSLDQQISPLSMRSLFSFRQGDLSCIRPANTGAAVAWTGYGTTISKVIGSMSNEIFVGSDESNVMQGGGGYDIYIAGNGANSLEGSGTFIPGNSENTIRLQPNPNGNIVVIGKGTNRVEGFNTANDCIAITEPCNAKEERKGNDTVVTCGNSTTRFTHSDAPLRRIGKFTSMVCKPDPLPPVPATPSNNSNKFTDAEIGTITGVTVVGTSLGIWAAYTRCRKPNTNNAERAPAPLSDVVIEMQPPPPQTASPTVETSPLSSNMGTLPVSSGRNTPTGELRIHIDPEYRSNSASECPSPKFASNTAPLPVGSRTINTRGSSTPPASFRA